MDILDKPFVTQEQKFEYWQKSKAEIKSLRKQLAEFQWISVQNKMPAMAVDVLCCCVNNRGDDYQKILGINPEGEWQSEGDYFTEDAFIDYWMPLPKPPKAISEKG